MSINKIYPSLIAGDLLNLERDIKLLEPLSTGFHIDIMDFHFVPNLTLGPSFVQAIRKITDKPLWVHLMVDEPFRYLPLLHLNKHDIVTIHMESIFPISIFNDIHRRGLLAGIAVNPQTPIETLVALFEMVDHITIMSVEPGFSGQGFILETINKVRQLTDLLTQTKALIQIGVDGGINSTTLPHLLPYHIENFVVGSGIFATANPYQTLEKLVYLKE